MFRFRPSASDKPFHRIRRVRVHLLVSGFARFRRRANQFLRAFKLAHHAVNVGAVIASLVLLRRVRHQFTHFRDGNCRKHAHEQENQRGEQSDGADKRGPVPDRRLSNGPTPTA